MLPYLSTNAFEDRDLGAVLATCEAHGIDALELSSIRGWDRSKLGTTAYPSRFLVHNYFPPADPPFALNLAAQDREVLERSRAHCRAAIDLSVELGGQVYAAHAGYTLDVPSHALGRPEILAVLERGSPDEGYAALVESAQGLCVYASDRGVRFLIENHVVTKEGRGVFLIPEPEELARLAEDVAHPSFGLLLDVGHLKVSAGTYGFDPEEAFDRLAPLTAAFHLSDNDGAVDAHRPFGDEAWFLPRLRDFPEACITLELAPLPIPQVLAVSKTVARWR